MPDRPSWAPPIDFVPPAVKPVSWQYTDSSKRTVVSQDGLRSCAADAPELAGLKIADPPEPSPARALSAALGAGCTISASDPARSGTYAIDPASQQRLQATALYVQVNGKFPAGVNSLPWPDLMGNVHYFTKDQFLAFATAVADYVAALYMVSMGVGSAPSQPVTIA